MLEESSCSPLALSLSSDSQRLQRQWREPQLEGFLVHEVSLSRSLTHPNGRLLLLLPPLDAGVARSRSTSTSFTAFALSTRGGGPDVQGWAEARLHPPTPSLPSPTPPPPAETLAEQQADGHRRCSHI